MSDKEMTGAEIAERNASMTAHALRKIAKQFNLPAIDVQKAWIDASIEYIEVTSGHSREEILSLAKEDGLDLEKMEKV